MNATAGSIRLYLADAIMTVTYAKKGKDGKEGKYSKTKKKRTAKKGVASL